jgi:hypothetical protein
MGWPVLKRRDQDGRSTKGLGGGDLSLPPKLVYSTTPAAPACGEMALSGCSYLLYVPYFFADVIMARRLFGSPLSMLAAPDKI